MQLKAKQGMNEFKDVFIQKFIRLIPETKTAMVVLIYKVWAYLLLAAFMLAGVFAFQTVFFASDTIGVVNLFDLTSETNAYLNISAITRSSILTFVFLLSVIILIVRSNKINGSWIKHALLNLPISLFANITFFLFFLWPSTDFATIYYLNILMVILLIIDVVWYAVVNSKALVKKQWSRFKLVAVILSYVAKFIGLISYLVFISLLTFNTNAGTSVFVDNTVITWLTNLFINIELIGNIITFLVLLLATLILLILVYLPFFINVAEKTYSRQNILSFAWISFFIFAPILLEFWVNAFVPIEINDVFALSTTVIFTVVTGAISVFFLALYFSAQKIKQLRFYKNPRVRQQVALIMILIVWIIALVPTITHRYQYNLNALTIAIASLFTLILVLEIVITNWRIGHIYTILLNTLNLLVLSLFLTIISINLTLQANSNNALADINQLSLISGVVIAYLSFIILSNLVLYVIDFTTFAKITTSSKNKNKLIKEHHGK